jgi:hypothetical protein
VGLPRKGVSDRRARELEALLGETPHLQASRSTLLLRCSAASLRVVLQPRRARLNPIARAAVLSHDRGWSAWRAGRAGSAPAIHGRARARDSEGPPSTTVHVPWTTALPSPSFYSVWRSLRARRPKDLGSESFVR